MKRPRNRLWNPDAEGRLEVAGEHNDLLEALRNKLLTSGKAGRVPGSDKRHRGRRAEFLKSATGSSDQSRVPQFVNVPKTFLILLTAASSLFALGAGGLLWAFYQADDPDVTLHLRDLFAWVLAPLGLAIYCWWLLRRCSERISLAGRDRSSAVAALAWVANIAVACLLGFYFWDDASFTRAEYHGYLVGQDLLQLLGVLSFVTVFVCAWAIARSVSGFVGLLLLIPLVAATYLSEASSVWLGL